MRRLLPFAFLVACQSARTDVYDWRECQLDVQRRDTMLDLVDKWPADKKDGATYRSLLLGLEQVKREIFEGKCHAQR